MPPVRATNVGRLMFMAVLLAVNVAAPFRTADQGRVLISALSRVGSTHHPMRVRAVGLGMLSQGYRVVVGVGRTTGPEGSSHSARCGVVLLDLRRPSRPFFRLASLPPPLTHPLRC